MLKRLKNVFASVPSTAVDPAQFGDELATSIAWSPLKAGGASLCTHRLVSADSDRCVFRATWRARAFYLVFLLVGVGGLIVFGPVHTYLEGLGPFRLVPFLIGLVLVIAGGTMFYLGTQPLTFDKKRGTYWTGRSEPAPQKRTAAAKENVALERIHAIQLLVERVRGNSSTYDSYELNLVLDDGSRVNLLDHSGLRQLRQDAEGLAHFLGVPVWDGT
jgi:hypothetical protein